MADVVGAAEHPLLNAQILSQLFKYSRDFQTLTQCRLVCSEWYKSTFSHWRSFVGAIRLGEADPNALTPTGWNVHEFLQNCIHGNTSENIPVDSHQYFTHWKEDPPNGYILSKVNLKSYCDPVFRVYDPEIDPVPPNTINFWQSVGSQITYIHFDNCVFQGDFQFLFEKMVVEMMPNLHSLKVTDCQLEPQKPTDSFSRLQIYVNESGNFKENVKRNPKLKRIDITGPCPICVYQLLIVSPEVKELALSTRMNWKIAEDYWARNLCMTLGPIRLWLDNKPYALKKLDLLNVVVYAAIGNDWRLENTILRFPVLEELSITAYIYCYPRDKDLNVKNGDDLKMMFSPQGLLSAWKAPKLKILKVFRPPVFPTPGFPLFRPGRADRLQELYLWGNVRNSFNFLWRMQGLKTLYLDFRCHDHLDKMEKLFYGEDIGNLWSVEQNRRWFRQMYQPEKNFTWAIRRSVSGKVLRMGRLERLHLDVPFKAECLNMLVVSMPHLTILEVVLDQKGFQAVCGWLTGLVELKLLYGSLIDDHTLTGLPEEEGMPVMRARSLTALKKLKRFEMKEIICNFEQGRLGDKSVNEGFLKMEGLKSVSICVSEHMSAQAENALKKHVKDVEAIRKHQSNENKICCQLQKFYGDVLQSLPLA